MLCPKCGQECSNEEAVCPICGAALREENAEAVETQTVETIAEETAEQTAEEALDAFADSLRVADTSVLSEEETEPTPKAKKPINLLAVAGVVLLLAVAVAAAAWFFGWSAAPTEEISVMQSHTVMYPNGFDYLNTDLSAYVTLGAYTGLPLDVDETVEVTEAEIEEYVEYMLSQMYSFEEVERAAANGDRVSIDYVGTVDGVAFEGGTGSTDTLVLGSGAMIPGFEDGIVGMNVGETKVIDVTFPTEYKNNPDLAGKPAQFEITLKTVSQKVDAVYTDEFVSENFGMATTAEFEAKVREEMEAQKQSEVENQKISAALTAAAENATFGKFPEGLVEDIMVQQITSLQQNLPYYYGIDYATFVEQSGYASEVDFEREMVRPRAEDTVKQEMVIFAVAKAEGFTVTDEEYQEELDYFLSAYGVEDLAALAEKTEMEVPVIEGTLRSGVLYNKAVTFLAENNG